MHLHFAKLLGEAIDAADELRATLAAERPDARQLEHIEALLLNFRSLHRRAVAGSVWGLGQGVELGALRYMADWWTGSDDHPLVQAVESVENFYAQGSASGAAAPDADRT